MSETASAEAALIRLRHARLRATAPAVQHEINNALMVLGANLDLLARSAAPGAAQRQVARAREALARLDETARGFLDAARRPAEDPALASLADTLRQALPLLRVALGARFGLVLEVGGEVPPVRLDRARLDLALLVLMHEAAGRLSPGARIRAEVTGRPGEARLRLDLPEGALPRAEAEGEAGGEAGGEAARLLAGAAEATGGRMEMLAGGVVLAWPAA